jgi:GTP-binding protein
MFFDAKETISKVDKQLVDEIFRYTKPCIFVVNKWDLGKEGGMEMKKWSDYLLKEFATMRHVPVAFVTAKDSRNVKKVVNLAQSIMKQAQERVSTGLLNRVVRDALRANEPKLRWGRRGTIFFATQISTAPPAIVVKCNDTKLFDKNWKRYLLTKLHAELPFKEVPIKLYFRGRDSEGQDEDRPRDDDAHAARDLGFDSEDAENASASV